MYPALIAPAVAAGSSAAHMVLTGLHNPFSASAPAAAPVAASSSGSSNFQAVLSTLQGQGVQGLVGLKSADLQQVLATLTPQQKVMLGQQLMGAKVAVENSGGQIVQGIANKLQIENGTPTFDVAGQKYSLGSLVSVLQTSAVA